MKTFLGFLLRLSPATLLLAGAPLLAQGKTGAPVRDQSQREAELQKNSRSFGVIDGIVTDSTLRPLSVSDVSVVGTGAKVTTEANGRFRFMQVPSGQYLIVVRRVGYAPTSGIIQVDPGDTLRLSYALDRSVMALDTIRIRERRVSMRMLEFEARRLHSDGQFITQEQIERRGSMAAADFLRTLRGIDVSRLTQTQFAGTVALSKREGGSVSGDGTGGCAMQILLDGIVLPRFFNLDLLPSPKQLAGIEVYNGAATVPPQFGGTDRRCGVIAFWTRDGY